MIAVFKREVNAYFKGVMGYLSAALLLIFAGIYTMAYNLSGYYSNFEYVLSSIAFIYLIFVPVLTMRSVAEEKKAKTDQLLYSMPISMSGVIVGKYLAMLTVLAVPVLIMGAYPVILSSFGTVSLKTAYSTLAAFFLLGACLMSVGLFVSSITESQVSSAVITLVAMLFLYFMSSLATFVSTSAFSSFAALCVLSLVCVFVLWLLTKNAVVTTLALIALPGSLFLYYSLDSAAFSGLFPQIMNALSVFDRFSVFVEGVFDMTAVVYYVSIIAVFLFLSVQAMEKRRWSE